MAINSSVSDKKITALQNITFNFSLSVDDVSVLRQLSNSLQALKSRKQS